MIQPHRTKPGFREWGTATLTRRYPFYSGCASLANSSLLRKFTGDSSISVWCRTPGGEVLASLDDYVGRAAYFVGDLDPKISWICRRLIRAGDTVLDIGANIGIVTLLMSRLAGPKGRVHAFEPQPGLLDRLQQTVQRNGLTNVRLHAVALGNVQTEMQLQIPAGNAGRASLVRDLPNAKCTTVKVPVDTLDRIIVDEKITRVRSARCARKC